MGVRSWYLVCFFKSGKDLKFLAFEGALVQGRLPFGDGESALAMPKRSAPQRLCLGSLLCNS